MKRPQLIVLSVIVLALVGALSYTVLGRQAGDEANQADAPPKIESREDLKRSQDKVNQTDVDSLDRDAAEIERDAEAF